MDKSTPVIILCGGLGTRMKEETEFKPKPMVLIGGKPILWHIMKTYAYFGYRNFVLALGYKGEMIKDYFDVQYRNPGPDDFNVTFAETGLDSMTGERMRRVKKYVTGDEFMVTYGDGVAEINIDELVAFHRKQGTVGTVTGTHPHSKYGFLKIDGERNLVVDFDEKPRLFDYISGGFMVFRREAFDYFDEGIMENALIKLAKEGQLSVYRHEGFWKSMDTYREMQELNELWENGRPWAVWEKEK